MLEESLELREGFARVDLLPPVLKLAIQRVAALPSSASARMTPAERVTLAHLVRCTNARDISTPIRVRKRVLAQNIGLSLRSLYRVLKALADRGFIDRPTQIISRSEGAQISHILWSDLAIESLFSRAHPNLSAKAHVDPVKEKNPSPCIDEKHPRPSSAKLAHACRDSQFIQRQSSHESSSRVPVDLRVLETVLDQRLIFKLMGIFTRAGKRLSTVINGRIEPILKSRKPYAYLLSLINSPELVAWKNQSIVNSKVAESQNVKGSSSALPTNFQLIIDGLLFKRTNNVIEVFKDASRVGSLSLAKFLEVHKDSLPAMIVTH